MSNTKMIYDDAKSIGIDSDSLEQLMNILTPRMQKQLVVSLKEEKFLKFLHWVLLLHQQVVLGLEIP